jgi:hypothetical protein
MKHARKPRVKSAVVVEAAVVAADTAVAEEAVEIVVHRDKIAVTAESGTNR